MVSRITSHFVKITTLLVLGICFSTVSGVLFAITPQEDAGISTEKARLQAELQALELKYQEVESELRDARDKWHSAKHDHSAQPDELTRRRQQLTKLLYDQEKRKSDRYREQINEVKAKLAQAEGKIKQGEAVGVTPSEKNKTDVAVSANALAVSARTNAAPVTKKSASSDSKKSLGEPKSAKGAEKQAITQVASLSNPNNANSLPKENPSDQSQRPEKNDLSLTWPTTQEWTSAQIEYAKERLAKVLELKQKTSPAPPIGKVKISNNSFMGSKSMEYLADDLYIADFKAKSGVLEFVVFGDHFDFVVPESDEGEVFQVVYDVSSFSSPKLYVFKKSLVESVF